MKGSLSACGVVVIGWAVGLPPTDTETAVRAQVVTVPATALRFAGSDQSPARQAVAEASQRAAEESAPIRLALDVPARYPDASATPGTGLGVRPPLAPARSAPSPAARTAPENVLRSGPASRGLRGDRPGLREPLPFPDQMAVELRAKPLPAAGSQGGPNVAATARPCPTAVTELRFRLTEARRPNAPRGPRYDRAVRPACYIEKPSAHWAKPDPRVFFLPAPPLEGDFRPSRP